MGATVELRQITAQEATAYVQEPAYLIQVERAKQKDFSENYHIGFDSEEWDKAHMQRGYDWIVLVKALVSLNRIAHSLIVHGGQPVGGLEESWQLAGDVKVLDLEQVAALYQALAPVSLSQADEHFNGHAIMLKDFQSFLKEAVETNKALLIFIRP
jgi:hypothetical protein